MSEDEFLGLVYGVILIMYFQSLEAYRLHVLFRVPQLSELDHYRVDVEEKVSAINLFNPPPELQATLDHITHGVYNFLQPKKIYEW